MDLSSLQIRLGPWASSTGCWSAARLGHQVGGPSNTLCAVHNMSTRSRRPAHPSYIPYATCKLQARDIPASGPSHQLHLPAKRQTHALRVNNEGSQSVRFRPPLCAACPPCGFRLSACRLGRGAYASRKERTVATDCHPTAYVSSVRAWLVAAGSGTACRPSLRWTPHPPPPPLEQQQPPAPPPPLPLPRAVWRSSPACGCWRGCCGLLWRVQGRPRRG